MQLPAKSIDHMTHASFCDRSKISSGSVSKTSYRQDLQAILSFFKVTGCYCCFFRDENRNDRCNFSDFYRKFQRYVRPIPIVLVKCWKVAHWNAKRLLKNCQKSKKLLPKFQKLLPKFLAIFI